ncbi:MAG: hypothetical protein MI744_06795 [Pseudomonadales bacterium]|nr:hypothetical protein [Pseudomonadales bacterium]
MNSKEYASALEALEEFHEDTPFPITQFYFYGYSAILLNRLGENSLAIPLAAKALDWASKDKNLLQNPRKRKFGLLKQNSVWPISEIERIASA